MTPTRERLDSVCAAAVDVARAALADVVDAGEVGDSLGRVAEGERLVTHTFACHRAGYRGWRWSVTLTRASRSKQVTVNEIVLLPGDESIVAPEWVPYTERLRSGDVGPGDLLPTSDDDPRLVPGWLAGDELVVGLLDEAGFGRERVLSLEGRDAAAERWYDGEQGPESSVAKTAPGQCRSCGFMVSLRPPLATVFGVCANEYATDDGRVVSLDHGCGAHSQVRLTLSQQPQRLPEPVFDTVGID